MTSRCRVKNSFVLPVASLDRPLTRREPTHKQFDLRMTSPRAASVVDSLFRVEIRVRKL